MMDIHVPSMAPTHERGANGVCDWCGRTALFVVTGADAGEVFATCGYHIADRLNRLLNEGWRAVVVAR